MVDVAAARVISTIREKACKDLPNARKYFSKIQIQSFTYLAIATMKLRM